MVSNCKLSPITDNDLLQFLRDAGCGSMQFELLRFVGKHPRAKLSFYTIARALGTASVELANSLTALIDREILAAEYDDNGLTTYSLSADGQTCDYICELANMDWIGASNIKKQLEGDLASS